MVVTRITTICIFRFYKYYSIAGIRIVTGMYYIVNNYYILLYFIIMLNIIEFPLSHHM